jgi:hypothetical protein
VSGGSSDVNVGHVGRDCELAEGITECGKLAQVSMNLWRERFGMRDLNIWWKSRARGHNIRRKSLNDWKYDVLGSNIRRQSVFIELSKIGNVSNSIWIRISCCR